jgi:hypothetical protein
MLKDLTTVDYAIAKNYDELETRRKEKMRSSLKKLKR